MKQDVHKFIKRHHLFDECERVIVAVSGGPDSMALLHYLWQMKDQYQIKVAACHLHHQLRGEEADADAHYVQQFCKVLGIPISMKHVNVKAYAKKQKKGTQVAARELRYQWFKELLHKYPNSKIATGHHGDDQIETMFMKMARGSLPLYTYGIPIERSLGRGSIIRPFLGITKEKIEHYCIEASIVPRRDSSNESNAYTRNRFRKVLLPFLKKENQNIHIHMQRQNEWENEDHEFLMTLAKEVKSSILIKESERNVTISGKKLLDVALPLQRRVIHLILSYLYGKNSPVTTSIHIEQVLEMLHSEKTSGEIHFSDSLFVRREYDVCHFLKGQVNTVIEQAQSLTIPGITFTSTWLIETYVTDDTKVVEESNQIILDYEEVSKPLHIRGKQPNDRMTCRGMEGTKKIGRLFIDRKISKYDRKDWPLLVDEEGRILWVPFLHRSKIANVSKETKKKLVVSCYRRNESEPDKGSDEYRRFV
ncbi:tRNA lysidine(34) synthetase TilS [Halalkalibacter kiskunsagensis]|uniref:tRNA(Ile)-lysidine synthase n=2 Tax=Halalkalibacter kiskunsagensis TaxID=1548599 RepID=A0ABV6KHV3_9BACI